MNIIYKEYRPQYRITHFEGRNKYTESQPQSPSVPNISFKQVIRSPIQTTNTETTHNPPKNVNISTKKNHVESQSNLLHPTTRSSSKNIIKTPPTNSDTSNTEISNQNSPLKSDTPIIDNIIKNTTCSFTDLSSQPTNTNIPPTSPTIIKRKTNSIQINSDDSSSDI